MKKKNMRREYYIYREIQFKYIRLCLLLMLMVCLIMGYTLNETSLGVLMKMLSKVYPAADIKGLGSIVNSTMILRLLFMIPVVVVATIYLSHRIAGPVYRLERELREIDKGDLSRRIILRKNDDLKKLANEINNVMNRMDIHVSTIRSYIITLQDSLEQFKKAEDPRAFLDKWGSTLEKASKELDYFKTSS